VRPASTGREGQLSAATRVYHRLATIEGASLDGMPVDLLARRVLCAVTPQGSNERHSLGAALRSEFLSG
jgi:hypothetical protein